MRFTSHDGRQKQHSGEVIQEPAVIDEQIAAGRNEFPDTILAVAIEQTRKALVTALLKYEALEIFPVNPAALASYRKAFRHGGGKNDPTDAMLLAQYLQHYHQHLRPLRLDSPLTRELASLAVDLEFPTNSGRSIKRVIVHARSVRNVEEISETGPS